MLDDLVAVVETLQQRIRDHGVALRENETRTRMALIDPVLTALGWDVSDPALVTPEYMVENRRRADYALLGESDKPAAVLEAKHLGESLGNHTSQMVTYALEDGVAYAGLTDGNQWQIYDVFRPVALADKRILDVSIANTPAYQCALQLLLLWRPNLASGRPVEANAPVVGWNPEVRRTTPEPGEQETRNAVEAPQRSTVSSPPVQGSWASLAEYDPPSRSPPPQSIRFPDGKVREISRWNDILVASAIWLSSTNRLTVANVPVTSSPKIYMVHDQPVHPTGNRFFQYREIADGQLVVNTHGSAVQMRNNARKLLQHCGISPDTVQLQVGQ